VATLGEHTQAVLTEIGYTPAEIAALVNRATAASGD
jgi:crotonobetainyl-CoA:carnitine CoA-transferase CaiB-like acyl-CoA transferase